MVEVQPDWSKIPVPMELFTKFNDIKFYDDVHKYYVNDKNLISVTTLLHKYQEDFESDYWAERKAIEYGLTKADVLQYWKALNIKSQIKGSAIHNYAELLFNNKKYKYNDEASLQQLGQINIDWLLRRGDGLIKDEYEIVRGYVDNFFRDSLGKLIPIKTEYVIFDKLWGLAGMLDILFWNVKKQRFQIWDYKTNKKLNKESEYKIKMKGLFRDMDDCEYSKYCLQLSTYKRIIERNTSIKIDGMYLVWLNEVNDNYKIIEVNDESFRIDMLFDLKG